MKINKRLSIALLVIAISVMTLGVANANAKYNVDEYLRNNGITDQDKSTTTVEMQLQDAFNSKKLTRVVWFGLKPSIDDIVVVRNGRYFVAWSSAELYNEFKNELESQKEALKIILNTQGLDMAKLYPDYEIVSINGVPWQETDSKDFIEGKINDEKIRNGSILNKNPKYLHTIKDSRFNGFSLDLYQDGKSQQQVLIQSERVRNGLPVNYKETVTGTPTNTSAISNLLNFVKNGVALQIGMNNAVLFKDSNPVNNAIMDTTPKVTSGITMIPLRGVFDQLGADISYNGSTKKVTIKTVDKTIVLTLGSDIALVNGKQVKMTKPATTDNGRTLIPLRFVGEQLGYKVTWIESQQRILIEK